jgi:acetylornithine/N-succinyldiaminopimelate aminotransferase
MTETLVKMDKKYILNTYNKKHINFKNGKNSTLFDKNGNKYIDFTSGIGVCSVGHANTKLSKCIYNQLNKLTHTSNLYLIEPQVKLANQLSKLSGYDMATFFCNSGAEANEGAIKLARKYGKKKFDNKKYKIITLESSFHGRTITTLKATAQKQMHTKDFSPYPKGFTYNTKLDDIYNSIDNETIAVMIELIQGEGGVEAFDKKEIQKLARFLKEKNILLIVDEVQTGIYRTGEFLCSNLYEIEPDIITLAKGLGGGIPIGAIMTKHKDIFQIGDHGSTFGGNYISSKSGLKVLDILSKYQQNGKLKENIEYFEKQLYKIYKKYNNIFTNILGIGFMRGLRVKNDESLNKIIDNSFKNRVLILKAGKNTLRFLPPLVITKKEIRSGFKRLENAIEKI